MLISTPYYRSLTLPAKIGCVDLPDANYGPYDLFCLNTRLYPIVYSMFGRDVEIILRSVYENDRMELKVNITGIKQDQENRDLSSVNDAVNKILSEHMGYCLIDKYELYLSSGKKYPKDWFYSVIPFVDLPTEYNPFISSNGIYLAFNPFSEYNIAYNQVVKTLLDTIQKYYREGVVYGAGNIAEQWKLEQMDKYEVRGKLYRPMWEDKRFGSPVEFLLGKIQGDPYIRINISDNLVKRHYVASKLNAIGISMIFDGKYVKTFAKNIDEAQFIAALIQSANKTEGTEGNKNKNKNTENKQAIVYYSNKLSLIYLYMEAAKELFNGNSDITLYQISNIERPYVFSCIVDSFTSGTSILEKLREMVLIK